jgi:hypothetical protein
MKIKNYIFSLLFLFCFVESYSQCSSCTYSISTASGNTNFNLNGNETVCIDQNVGNLNINFNGSNNTICINIGITWTQTNGLNLATGTNINVNGNFVYNAGLNANGTSAITIASTGSMTTNSSGFGNNLTITNNGALTFTNTGQVRNQGSFVFNNSGTLTATAPSLFFIGNGNTVTNSLTGTMSFTALENEEASSFNNFNRITVTNLFNNHGAINNQNTGHLTVGSLRVGDKGPGKQFINNGIIVSNGNVLFEGPATNNGGIQINTGGNLTVDKLVTGTNGWVNLEGGTSTITSSGSFTGSQTFSDENNTIPSLFDSAPIGTQLNTPGTLSLPIKIISFTSQIIPNAIMLSWTASEAVNFSKFNLERSNNAKDFETIFEQITNDEALSNSYNFTDNNPIIGENYYRLKNIDKDGSFSYSKIISVDYSKETEYVFFENPIKNQKLLLNTNMVKPSISIFDINGKPVEFKVYKGNPIEISFKKVGYETLLLKINSSKTQISRRIVFE